MQGIAGALRFASLPNILKYPFVSRLSERNVIYASFKQSQGPEEHTAEEMSVSTSSEKKPIVQQTIRLRIEKFETLMDSDKSSIHWSEGVSSKLMPQAIWKLKLIIYATGNVEKRRGSISVGLYRTGPMVEKDLYANFYLYFIDRLGIRIDVEKRDSYNFKKAGDGWGCVISQDQVKRALRADDSLLVGADVWVHAPYDAGGGGRGAEEAIQQAWNFRGDVTQRQPSVNSPTDKTPSNSSTEAWDPPSDDETRWRASVNSPSVSYGDKTSSDRSIEFERRTIWLARTIDKVFNVGNVVAMAVLADSFSADKLKKACTELIAREGNTVFESDDWKKLKGTKPKLAIDLAFGAAALVNNTHSAERIKKVCIGLITSHWRTVYKTAVWRVLRETKPQFALDLAEEATHMFTEKK